MKTQRQRLLPFDDRYSKARAGRKKRVEKILSAIPKVMKASELAGQKKNSSCNKCRSTPPILETEDA
ncbi:hypothetical protein [Bythopirellula polymerisocia]|uniref:Uncharacterized protein n=1 Tax=Bythopirellula polymerisocia TaxID=2528003 RepID=A0A5C6C9Q5_9BACT|nr:hypothetical protein [Bythopirellula polymerisocia]TWU20908.1 hypothetical protein Pla144_48090 [Bythopirellula polymerisocia]